MSAGGYVQSEILFAPEVGTGVITVINPTLTVLCGPFNVVSWPMLAGQIENPDLTQVIQATAQGSWDGVTKWADVPQFFDLKDIAPQEIRPFALDCSGFRFIRFTGTASGVGINNVEFRLMRNYSNGGARGPIQRW